MTKKKKFGNAALKRSIPKWLSRLTYFAEIGDRRGLKISASAIVLLAKTPHFGLSTHNDLRLKRLAIIAVSIAQESLAEKGSGIGEETILELHSLAAEAQLLRQ